MANANEKVSEQKVWKKYYSDDVWNMEPPKHTIYSYLKEVNKDRFDSVAIHYYGANITYRRLFKRIDECANAFSAMGVKQGDIVSLLSVSTPEALIALYALNKIGATMNAIDPRMDVDSIRRMITESGSEILITIDLAFPKVDRILSEIKQRKIIVQSASISLPLIKKIAMKLMTKTKIPYGENIITWKTFIADGKGTVAKEAPYVGDATVAITYTGGTTGFPKGVMLTNDSMNAVAINFIYCGLVYEKGDRFLGIMPIFSSYGMVCGLHMPLALGLELALIPKFIPATIGELVKKYRPQHMISTPAFYEILINSEEMKGLDLSFLITLGSGGDTMNAGLENKLLEFMKEHNIRYPLAQGYGMSELSAAASFCVNDRYKPSSVGIPSLTTTVGIFTPDTDEELGYNVEGEICVTGPSMMKGYFNRPEETANVMRKHSDGKVWIHSGDLGYMDEDGFIYVIGRFKRMITRFDGHKVFPVNIESLVMEHTSVRNCVAIGVNDLDRTQGQYPLVLVELAEGVDEKATCKDIFDMCNEKLEERGKPVGVIAVEAIPLTGMGKNDYRTLEKQYKDFDYKSLNQG